MKDKLVREEDILNQLPPALQGKGGRFLIRGIMNLAGIRYANRIYDNSKELTGAAFCKDVLDKLGIKREVRNIEVFDSLKDQPFITVSNHPFGHIDGIALMELMANINHNYRIMVNYFLGLIDTMSDHFIPVNPHANNKTTLKGIKECISHLNAGKPLGLFPAGAVSRFKREKGKLFIEDREWQESVLKLIQRMKVPVVPIHISGKNSNFFYALRWFGYQVRDLRLCHELYNKKNTTVVLTIGEQIMPDKIKEFSSARELGEFLKKQTYQLSTN